VIWLLTGSPSPTSLHKHRIRHDHTDYYTPPRFLGQAEISEFPWVSLIYRI